MIRKKRKNSGPIVIDLTGPQGNEFYLMGVVQSTFNKSGAAELGESIIKEMKSGNYEHLLKTLICILAIILFWSDK